MYTKLLVIPIFQAVQRALDFQDIALGYVGVTFGGTKRGVAKQTLDVADVGAVFK
jgi:hypothetical protein